jgi:hypothetical protein
MPHAKPVLMCVDDEPEVLAAIERDLRGRYGRDCLAMGITVRRLEVPGAEEFSGAGLYYARRWARARPPVMMVHQYLDTV